MKKELNGFFGSCNFSLLTCSYAFKYLNLFKHLYLICLAKSTSMDTRNIFHFVLESWNVYNLFCMKFCSVVVYGTKRWSNCFSSQATQNCYLLVFYNYNYISRISLHINCTPHYWDSLLYGWLINLQRPRPITSHWRWKCFQNYSATLQKEKERKRI